MAEEEKETTKEDKTEKKSSGIVLYIVMALMVLVCAGAGLGLGKLFAGNPAPENETQDQSQAAAKPAQEITTNNETKTDAAKTGKTWYFELDPIIANLNEPGATRYVMVTLIIEVNPTLDETKGTELLKEKSYPIKNWLTIYFASLTLEDIQGDKNLKRIQSYICEMLNDKLFPNAKPQLGQILFKEFAIQ